MIFTEKTDVICPHCGENNKKQNYCFECENSLLLNDRYYLLNLLGENIGITYLAIENKNEKLVVIKELSVKSIEKWKTEELFKREGDVLKRLDHKSIPDFIEQFIIEGTYYLAMEYVKGLSLDKELETKRYREDEIYEIVDDVTNILQYLQSFEIPIIHRDIKLSNLIRNEKGGITLIDFGGVKHFINSTRGSTMMGTIGYAAPEQLAGKAVIQSDFYSLGMVVLILLTREDIQNFINHPFNREDYDYFSNKMIMLIQKLTAKRVEKRFQTTTEILKFLKRDEKSFNEEKKDDGIIKHFFQNIKKIFIKDYEVDSQNSSIIWNRNKININIDKIICPNCLANNSLKDSVCIKCNKLLLLNDRYKLFKILGKNIGTTYLAKDIKSKNKKKRKNIVVIKELSVKKIKQWKNEELFKRERVALSTLNHKRIPKFLELFDKKTGKKVSYYTVIEYIDGLSLNKIIEDKVIKESEVIKLLKDISEILDYIHSLNPPIIHRDLKPSNIIVRGKDYYLIDFNSITDILKEEGGSTITGTFGYMAPEQFLGKANTTIDYYALGILSLEMLTGISPKEFLVENRINWNILDISSKMRYILESLLEYDYRDRIKNREELLKIIKENSKKDEDKDKKTKSKVKSKVKIKTKSIRKHKKVDKNLIFRKNKRKRRKKEKIRKKNKKKRRKNKRK